MYRNRKASFRSCEQGLLISPKQAMFCNHRTTLHQFYHITSNQTRLVQIFLHMQFGTRRENTPTARNLSCFRLLHLNEPSPHYCTRAQHNTESCGKQACARSIGDLPPNLLSLGFHITRTQESWFLPLRSKQPRYHIVDINTKCCLPRTTTCALPSRPIVRQ